MFLSHVFSMFFQNPFMWGKKMMKALWFCQPCCHVSLCASKRLHDWTLSWIYQVRWPIWFCFELVYRSVPNMKETLKKTHIRNIRGDVFFQVWKAHRFYFKVPSCCLSWADTPGVDEEKSWRLDQRCGSCNLLKPFEWRLLEQRHWRFSHRNFQKTWKEQWCSSTAS